MPLHDEVICGDSREVLKTLPDGCADALVSDPPSGTHFMGLDFDHNRGGRDQWIAWLAGIMAEARRCVRPGGYALVWALPRTSHWTGLALEEAGFELRDQLSHLFAQGFPKSKSCLKPAHETWWLAKAPGALQPLQIDACRVPTAQQGEDPRGQGRPKGRDGCFPFSDDSWGNGRLTHTEGHSGGRWPSNALFSHHPDCVPAGVRRVRGSGSVTGLEPSKPAKNVYGDYGRHAFTAYAGADGCEQVETWFCHESCPVRLLDEQAGPRSSGATGHHTRRTAHQAGSSGFAMTQQGEHYGDTGNASRFFTVFPPDPEEAVPFFYCAKASRTERNAGLDGRPERVAHDDVRMNGQGTLPQETPNQHRPQANHHACVKPLALGRWLTRLVAAPGSVVLDPFCGSGSLSAAAVLEGCHYIAIDCDESYCAIARARIAYAHEQRAGPLFATAEKDA